MIRELDWNATVNQTVRVYRNLNNGKMSVQQKIEKRWIVVGHVTDAIVHNVRFHVSEAGRQRVIEAGRKNVHAWGEGILVAQFNPRLEASIPLGYDPYRNESFVHRLTQHKIVRCQHLIIRENQVWVSADACRLEQPSQQPKSTIQISLWALQWAAA